MTTTDYSPRRTLTAAERIKSDDPTSIAIAEMLAENTGRHFLDSGGAYGRNWERNAGTSVRDWVTSPVATWGYRHEWISVSVFHYLTTHLTYLPELTEEFQAWAQDEESGRTDDSWLANMEEWAADHNEIGDSVGGHLTYNYDNPFSQDFQWTEYVDTDDDGFDRTVIMLQIHGGCDIRGGYTVPRLFQLDNPSDVYFGDCDVELYCPNGHGITIRGNVDVTDENGEWLDWSLESVTVEDEDTGELHTRCHCGEDLIPDARLDY